MQGSPIDVLKTKTQYNSKTQLGDLQFLSFFNYKSFSGCRVEVEVLLPDVGTQSKVMSCYKTHTFQ